MIPRRGLLACANCNEIAGSTEQIKTLINFWREAEGKEPSLPVGHAITAIKLLTEERDALKQEVERLKDILNDRLQDILDLKTHLLNTAREKIELADNLTRALARIERITEAFNSMLNIGGYGPEIETRTNGDYWLIPYERILKLKQSLQPKEGA